MAVYARTRIPAAVLALILNLNREHIFFAVFNMISNIKPKTCIAVRVLAKVAAIDKNCGVHINTIKLDNDAFPFLRRRNGKCFAIPTCSAGGKSAAYLAYCSLIKRR